MKSLINREILAKVLDEEGVNEAATEQVTYVSSGPGGEPDKWFLVMEDRKNIWQIREQLKGSNKRKSLIFSHPALAQRRPTYTELCFIAALVEHYDVYLWEGQETNLANASPIIHSAQFWQNRGKCKPASAREVTAFFDLQGKSANEYVVLDATNYWHALEKLKLYFESAEEKAEFRGKIVRQAGTMNQLPYQFDFNPHVLNLTTDIYKFTDALKNADPNIVTEIIVEAEDFDSIDLAKFPKLEKLCILTQDPHSIEYFIPIIKQAIQLEFKNPLSLEQIRRKPPTAVMIIPQQTQFVLSHMKIGGVIISSSTSDIVEEIRIENVLSETIGISSLKNLKHLVFVNTLDIGQPPRLLLVRLHNLEEIDALDMILIVADDCSFTKLKRLCTTSQAYRELNEYKLTTLTELYISAEIDNTEPVMIGASPIKTLTITNCDNESLALNHLTVLESLTLKECGIGKLMVNECRKLKKLNIIQCTGSAFREKLDLSQLVDLEEITIESALLDELDLSQCKKLKKIYIEGCIKLSNIIHPPLLSLETLHIIHSHYLKMDITSAINLKELQNTEKNSLTYGELDLDVGVFRYDVIKTAFKVKKLTLDTCEVIDAGFETIKNADDLSLISLQRDKKQTRSIVTTAKAVMLNGQIENIDFKTCSNLAHLEWVVMTAKQDCLQGILNDLKHLKTLSLGFCHHVLHLSFSGFLNLEALKISYGSKLKTLNFNNCPKLKKLTLDSLENMDHLDLSQLSHLEELTIDMLETVKSLDLSKLTQLKRLTINNCTQLGCLILPPNLEFLKLAHRAFDQLEELDLSPCKVLKYLNVSGGTMLLDLESCAQLEQIALYTPNTKLDLRALKQLKSIWLGSPWIESVDCAGLTQLINLQMFSNKLDDIDLSDTQLQYLEVKGMCVPKIKGLTPSNIPKQCHLEFKTENLESAELSSSVLPTNNVNIANSTGEVEAKAPFSQLAIEEKLDLIRRTRENEKSSVSCFSRFKPVSRQIDARTGDQSVRQSSEDITVQVISAYKSIRQYYRWNVFNHVAWQNGPVLHSKPSPNGVSRDQVWPTYQDADLPTWQQKVKQEPSKALGLLRGNLLVGERYALTSEFPQTEFNIEVFCKDAQGNPVAGSLIWDPDHRQHYFQLNKAVANIPIEILYYVNQVPHYNCPPPAEALQAVPADQLLPQEMLAVLTEMIENHSGLKAIYALPALSERFFALMDFCENKIKQGDLSRDSDDPIEVLRLVLTEGKGVCRHKAEAFMYLARYMGISVNKIGSEDHSFCEILAANAWYRADLGGGDEWDNTPEHARQSKLVADSHKTRPTKAEELAKPILAQVNLSQPVGQQSLFTPEFDQTVQKYMDAFHAVANETQLSNLDSLFSEERLHSEKRIFPPLLRLERAQSPYAVGASLIQTMQQSVYKDKAYVFIDSAHDFAYYLSPPHVNQYGERKKISGPLQDIIDKGGVVIVNWANFSPAEIASYKSILDTKPTLLGKDLFPGTLVIGMQHNDNQSCASFDSRSQPFTIDPGFRLSKLAFDPPVADKKPVTVNLFKLNGWRKHLLGDIKFKGNDIMLKAGPLKKAIDQGRPIIIENPPVNDKTFELLLHRLKTEKRIYYNGVQVPIKAGFTVTTTTKTMPNQLESVSVVSQTNLADKRKHIYLGLHNLHECIEQLHIENTLAEDVKGYLETFDINQQVFYLTQNIPEADWQYLLHHIQHNKKLAGKQFEFKLAPMVSIENVATNNNALVLENGVHISNDPDYRALELQQEYGGAKKALIIDVSLETSFSDLLAKIEHKPHQEQGKVNFEYTEKTLLRKLAKGRTLILNGPISTNLYQQLLPLLSESGYLNLNGARKNLKGKLISVQPHTQKHAFQHYHVKDFSINDYLEKFPVAQHELIKQIDQFYQLAHLLPHRGAGRPNKPQLTMARISGILQRLSDQRPKEKRLHANNPIKGIFHYDYPKDSEDYAYLNVMAKYLFGSKLAIKNQPLKLRGLMQSRHINSVEKVREHGWQLLNCLSPAEIKKILSDKDKDFLMADQAYPKLSPNAVNQLWKALSFMPAATEKKKLHVDKRQEQFEVLLADPATPLIITKGDAGAGKTYTSEQLKKRQDVHYHDGVDAIINWLKDPGEVYTLLALDEVNMAKPGTWNFLKALFRDLHADKKVVYYKGQKYTITKNHKILSTGNPESYAERYHHEVLQQYGETLYFKRPDDIYIADNILNNIFQPLKLNDKQHIDPVLQAFQAIRAINSSYYYSNRDIISAAERFVTLYKALGMDSKEVLYYACMTEFSGTLTKQQERNQFDLALAQIFGFKPAELQRIKQNFAEKLLPAANSDQLIELTAACAVPVEASYLLESMQQALLTRQRVREGKDTIPYHKKGFLIEGEPGFGKSTMIEALLEYNGFSKTHTDPKMKYHLISASNESQFHDLLEEAYRDCSVVILDEINLDEKAEQYINKLLDKAAEEGREFMIFSSQNAASTKGRASTSSAMRNRFHVAHAPAFTNESLVNIAKHWKVPEPDKFAKAYINCHAENERINMRTYYNLAKHFGQRTLLQKKIHA